MYFLRNYRLPVFQGPTPAYIIPILALASLPEWKCPDDVVGQNTTGITTM
jgi:hypothetical protein